MRSTMLAATMASGVLASAATAQVMPSGGKIVAGSAGITTSGATTLIAQSSGKAVIDWQSFSIGQGGTVQFDNGNGATLNRVTGGNLSSIDGLLSATGSVYLINPNGVIIGKSGVVKVGGGFVASTLDIDNANFLSGGDQTLAGTSLASVINLGRIGALGGDVALVAANVRNDGTVVAPNGTLGLLAGNRILMRDAAVNDGKFLVLSGGAGTSVTNTGTIEAATAELRAEGGNVYALAGNTTGLIRATGVTATDGHIYLTAGAGGTVAVSGSTLKAGDSAGNGGTISITGGQINVASDATLDASATAATGNGGTVSAIADMTSGSLAFQGTALAKGGINAGSGGNIETSGHSVDFDGAKIDTSAVGTSGTWRVDPYDLTIDSTAASTIDGNLATTDVTLQTTSSGTSGPGNANASGNGDIIIDSALSWSSGHVLTLDAYHSIQVNANITVAGAGGVVLKTNDGGSGGDYTFALGESLNYTGSGGSLTINNNAYTLLTSMAGVAGMNNQSGYYALATSVTPSSSYTNDVVDSFSGTFTGLGHTINNLIVSGAGNNIGLFGVLQSGSVVRDIGIWGGSITGGTIAANSLDIGSLAGEENGGTISYAYASATVSAGAGRTGGLVGTLQSGTISSSFATGAVSGNNAVGGLVGYNNGTISNSYATGGINSTGTNAGSLVGNMTGTINYSYGIGKVTGVTNAGGLSVAGGTITDGYYDKGTTGQSGGGGTGETTSALQGTLPSGFSSSAWGTGTGLYPYLKSFYPNGVTAVSGTAANSSNTAVSQATVSLYSGGALLGSATSGANGYYYIPVAAGTAGSTAGVTETLSGAGSVSGAAYSDTNLSTSNVAGLNVTSGAFNYFTNATSYASFNATVAAGAASAFGSSYTSLQTTLASASGNVYAYGGLTIDGSLATGTTLVKTLGGDLTVNSGLTLSGTAALTLDAYNNLNIDANITAPGANAVTLTTGDGGSGDYSFSFGKSLSYTGTGGSLTINGTGYTLIQTMSAVAALNAQSGHYALAGNITGGTYNAAVISSFIGTFTGLGHTIDSLTINNSGGDAGLVDNNYGTIRDLGLTQANISGNDVVGAVAAWNQSGGKLDNIYVTGTISGGDVGGVVSQNMGTIANSFANVTVTGTFFTGGITGYNGGSGILSNTYATGMISSTGPAVGGLTGVNDATISNSYSTALVSGSGDLGGVTGRNSGTLTNTYWDTSTSGTSTGIGSNYGGATATGLTTAQLQSGSLPSGFGSNWTAASGLDPRLTSFGLQIIGGYAYTSNGSAANLATLGLYSGGALLGGSTVTTAADGSYSVSVTPGVAALGITEILNGATTVSGLSYSDVMAGNVNVTSGTLQYTTSLTSYSALNGSASSAFGQSLYNTLTSGLAAAPTKIYATGAFTIDSALTDSAGMTIKTEGGDLTIDGAITVGGSNSLTLDSYGSIFVDADINAPATSGGQVVLTTNDGGSGGDYVFGIGNSLTFGGTSDALTINGNAYTLIGSLSSLAGLNSSSGRFALTQSLNAAGTTHTDSLVDYFSGTFEGLGHTIDGLTIASTFGGNQIGLFGYVNGTVRDLGVTNANISFSGMGGNGFVGTVAGLVYTGGTLQNVYSTGTVSVSQGQGGGGLAGINYGQITNAFSTASVTATDSESAGGLVAENGNGTLTNTFATGSVSGTGGSFFGGLVGFNSYATINTSFATGPVANVTNAGGLVGYTTTGSTISNSYYDSGSTGMSDTGKGTAQTTAQLQGSLPSGFSSSAWNTGSGLYPYLKTLFPAGIQVVSGTALTSTSAGASQATIGLYENGTNLATLMAGANGYYYIPLVAGTGGGFVGVTETLSGASSVSGAAFSDVANLSDSGIIGLNVASGAFNSYTALTSYAAFKAEAGASAAFGSTYYASLQTTLASASKNLYAYGNFTIDSGFDASSPTLVKTLGGDLTVSNDLTLSGTTALTLDASDNLFIDANVTASGANIVTLKTADGGSGDYSFALGKSLSFTGTGGSLTINDQAYTLVYSMSDIAALNGESGYYALATSLTPSSSYSASVTDRFWGTFTGLGHTVNNLTIDSTANDATGLFGSIYGTVRDIGIVGGSITGTAVNIGGLVGYNQGIIQNAYSSATVNGATTSNVGGLVGDNEGTIINSFATGAVTGSFGVGGLVGDNDGTITNAYATGAVSGDDGVGGLVGQNDGAVTNGFAAGYVTATSGTSGGLVAYDQGPQPSTGDYDTDTTGQSDSNGTGETTAQLQSSSLSTLGFDSTVWGTGPGLYPYLKSFFPNGAVSVSGNTAVTSATLNLYSGGNLLGSATSGANGYYYIPVAIGAAGSAAGVTETLSGAGSVSGAAYSDTANLSSNSIAGLNVTSGAFSYDTALTSYAALKTAARSTFGSGNYTSLQSTLSSASYNVYASGAFTIDSGFDTTAAILIKTLGGDLTIASDLSVGGGTALTLDSYGNLYFDANLTASGANAMTLTTSDGGSGDYAFALGKSMSFTGSGGSLTINGTGYTLLNSMAGVAAMNGQSGHYALAASLTPSSSYTSAVTNTFSGVFTGLGHTITNLTITGTSGYAGLIGQNAGTVRDVGLVGGSIQGAGYASGLVGTNSGTIRNAYSSATVTGSGGYAGGLVGYNQTSGTITNSFATGAVKAVSYDGGLVGLNYGIISNTYATGSVTATGAYAGGLVGRIDSGGSVTSSYTTAAATGGVYGLLQTGTITNSYYDSTTRGSSSGTNGTALTTTQLQSAGLQSGFSAAIWGSGSGLYPYLKTFYPGGVVAVSGIATDSSNAATAGASVSLYGSGNLLGSAFSGANGYYYVPTALGSAPGTAGLTETLSGAPSVSGMAYTDAPTLTSGQVTGFNVQSGQITIATGATTYSALQTTLSNTFGSGAYTTLSTAVGTAGTSITASNGFSFDQSATFGGALSVTAAGGITLTNTIGATGAASFNSAVTLAGDSTISAGSGAVTFGSTIDGGHNLTVNTSGATTFGGTIGGTTGLTSLTTDSGGMTSLGANVTTTGGQSYGDALTLTGDATLTSTGSGAIAFSTINGAHNLTVNTSGATTFGGVVGGSTALTSLTTNSGGTTSLGANVTTTGAQSYGDALTLTGDATLTSTGSGAIGFSTINGAHNLTVDTSGATTFGGVIGGTTALSSLTTDSGGTASLGANVTTTGAQSYGDALTLTGDATLTSTSSGAIAFSTINGAHNLTVDTSGATTFNGAIGGSTALTSLITDSGGTTSLGGNITTTGAQSYGDALTLTGDATLTSTGSGAIAFSTINGAHNLTVNTSGATTFGGAAGGTTALTSLTTNSGGTTSLGANVTTTGAQSYGDALTLTGDATLTSTGSGAIGFSTINGAHNLTVDTSGATTFGGVIGGSTVLTSLTTDTGGTTSLAGNVTTTGAQSYGDALTLTGGATLTSSGGGNISLHNVNGGDALSVTTTGAITLGGVVGGSTPLRSLAISASGSTTLSGNVTTTAAQSFGNALTLTGNATLSSTGGGAISVGTVNGDHGLTLTTSGSTGVNGVIGGTAALASLTIQGGTSTLKNNITTIGAQTYTTTVNLSGNATLTSTGSGAIAFASLVSGPHALSVNTSGTITFKAVGGSSALTSLTTGSGGATTLDGPVTTTGAQAYGNAVTLAKAVTLTSTGGGAMSFGTIDGGFDLTLATSGTTTLGGAVGGSTALTSLTVDSGGTTSLAGNVTTTGLQSYGNPLTLTANTTLAAGGGLTLGSTVNGAYSLSLSGSRLTFNGAVGGTTALTSLSGTATSGDIDINGQISTTGAILLAADGNFVNTAGSTALNPGGNFTVYTQTASNPTGAMPSDTWDGLTATNYYNDAYDFTHGTFASAVPTGNHFVYGYAASLTPTLSGSASKTYDAGATASTSGLTLGYGSLLSGSDNVTLSIGSAAYDNRNAGSGKTVTASGITLSSNPNNYTLASTSASAAIGTISQATLTLEAVTDTKTYDATKTSSGVVDVVGLQGSDTVTGDTQSFTSKNVLGTGGSTLAVNSGYTVNDGNSGGNYTVTTQAATGTINKAALTLAAVTDTKTYDATTDSAGTVSVIGLQGSDTVTGETQSFGSKNVLGTGGSTLAVNSGYTVNDGNSGGNYTVVTQAATGTINKAALTLAAVIDTKTYDATETSSGTVSVSGLLGSDTVTSDTQSFASKNVLGVGGSTLAVNSGYTVNDGNNGGNYTVSTQTATGTINKAALTLAAVTDTKTYDATATSTGAVEVTGLQGSDTVTGDTQSFTSKNVLGTGGSTLAVNSGYSVNDGNSGGNYTVTTQAATGTINKATLTLAAVTDTKTYDATANSAGTVSVSGLLGSDTVTGETQSFGSKNVLGADGSTLAVNGGYTVDDGNSGGNYTVTTQTATGTINKATLTLAAVTDTKTYDATATSTGAVDVIGLQGSDTVTGDTQSFGSKNVLGAGGSTLAVNGGYSVNDGNSGGNYTVTTQTASGTINKAALTLAAVTDTKTYDATANSAGIVSVSGLLGSDTVTGDTQSFTSKNVLGTGGSTLAVNGGYTVNDGNSGGNYTVTTQTASGTIIKAALILAAVTDTKTYDATTNSAGTVSVTGLQGSDTITGDTQSFTSKNVMGAGGSTLAINGGYTVSDGNSGGNYTVTTQTATGTIDKATLTAGLTGTASKTYDATISATLTAGNYALSGVLGSDAVDLNDPTSGTYADKNAGTGKIVSVAGLAIFGTDAGNYTLASSSASGAIGTINKAALTLAATSNTKTYDATTASTGSVDITGLKGSDTVTGTSESFASKNVLGTGGSTLAVNGGYTVNDGNGGGNYTLTTQTASGTITPATLVAGLTGSVSKTYDATVSATLTAGNYALSGILGSDSVSLNDPTAGTYADKNAGAGKTVSVTGLAISGTDAGNYTLNGSASAAIGTIDKAALTLAAVTDTKTYDATTASTGAVDVTGLQGSDTVTGASESFDSKNAGSRTLSVNAVYVVNDGNGGGNYAVTTQTAFGTIDPAALIAGLTGTTSKTYDATLTATLTAGNYTLTGLKGSDSVALNDPATGAYADPNAGTGKAVTVTGLALSGADAGNYTVNGQASANIGTILLRDLTITAGDPGKDVGATDPALTYAITSGSLAGSDNLSGGLTRDTGENPGAYAITQGSLAASSNYDVTFVPGVFTITAVAMQNDPVVNPVSTASGGTSQPSVQSAPIGLSSGSGPTSSDASSTTSSSSGSGAKDAGSASGGDEKASGPNIQTAGQSNNTCAGDGCSNTPYPTNQVISSSISFSQ